MTSPTEAPSAAASGPRVEDGPSVSGLRLPVLVDDAAIDVVVAERDRALAVGPAGRDGEEAPLLAVEPVVLGGVPGAAAGVLVARRAAAELVQAGLGVDRVVLPVPVAADDEQVVELPVADPAADLPPLMGEGVVGVVVVLVGPVGA